MIRRAEAAQARQDTRNWAVQRRARTRRLIELGGLIAKSDVESAIVPMEPDTRAVILGLLLALTEDLQQHAEDPTRQARVVAWRERGRRALREPAVDAL